MPLSKLPTAPTILSELETCPNNFEPLLRQFTVSRVQFDENRLTVFFLSDCSGRPRACEWIKYDVSWLCRKTNTTSYKFPGESSRVSITARIWSKAPVVSEICSALFPDSLTVVVVLRILGEEKHFLCGVGRSILNALRHCGFLNPDNP